VQVLNFYSTVFADQMKRGRKTATIRLGDKRHKYRKNQVVLVTVGYQYSPREKLFHAVIDNVEVKRVKDLSPRDIEHDNPEFRRTEELVHFLEQIYGREVGLEDTVTVVRFSQIVENPPDFQDRLRGVDFDVHEGEFVSVLGASGTLGVGAPAGPLAITNVTAQPETVSPNGDGQADQTTLTYTLSQPALVSISLLDSIGSDLGYLVKPVRKQAGMGRASLSDLRCEQIWPAASMPGRRLPRF